MSCRAELCIYWTGQGCVCQLLDLEPEPTCPECKAGKHRNCDGSAWSDALDDLVECACPCIAGREVVDVDVHWDRLPGAVP